MVGYVKRLTLTLTVICNYFKIGINYPCSHLLGAEPPLRNISNLYPDYVDDIGHFTDQTTDAKDFRHALNAIHDGTINTFIDYLQ